MRGEVGQTPNRYFSSQLGKTFLPSVEAAAFEEVCASVCLGAEGLQARVRGGLSERGPRVPGETLCVNRTVWARARSLITRAGYSSTRHFGRRLQRKDSKKESGGRRWVSERCTMERLAEVERGAAAALTDFSFPFFPSRAGCSLPTPVTVATVRIPPAPRLRRNRSVAAAAAGCRTRCYCRCRRRRRLAWSFWPPR